MAKETELQSPYSQGSGTATLEPVGLQSMSSQGSSPLSGQAPASSGFSSHLEALGPVGEFLSTVQFTPEQLGGLGQQLGGMDQGQLDAARRRIMQGWDPSFEQYANQPGLIYDNLMGALQFQPGEGVIEMPGLPVGDRVDGDYLPPIDGGQPVDGTLGPIDGGEQRESLWETLRAQAQEHLENMDPRLAWWLTNQSYTEQQLQDIFDWTNTLSDWEWAGLQNAWRNIDGNDWDHMQTLNPLAALQYLQTGGDSVLGQGEAAARWLTPLISDLQGRIHGGTSQFFSPEELTRMDQQSAAQLRAQDRSLQEGLAQAQAARGLAGPNVAAIMGDQLDSSNRAALGGLRAENLTRGKELGTARDQQLLDSLSAQREGLLTGSTQGELMTMQEMFNTAQQQIDAQLQEHLLDTQLDFEAQQILRREMAELVASSAVFWGDKPKRGPQFLDYVDQAYIDKGYNSFEDYLRNGGGEFDKIIDRSVQDEIAQIVYDMFA